MFQQPQISVIIPTYNCEDNIERCLYSILNQTYTKVEILVVDGASTDTTLEKVRSVAKINTNIKFVSEPDNGIYDAMNKGINLATGDWLYFLGSDDYFYSNSVLERIFTDEALDNHDVVYGNVWNEFLNAKYDGEFSYLKLTKGFICHQAIFYNRRVFNKLGLYDIECKVYAHIAFDIQAFCNKNISWTYVDEIVAYYSSGGYSASTFDKKFWRNAEELLRNTIGPFVPKKNLYRTLEPIVRYDFGWHSLIQSLRIIYYTRNYSLLKNVARNYRSLVRPVYNKVFR